LEGGEYLGISFENKIVFLIKLLKMIKHIVCWTFKENAEGCRKKENIEKIKTLLEDLKEKIPVIQSLEIGINFDKSPDAYDLALYAEFKSKEDLNTYQKHPEHLAIVQFLKKVRDKKIVVDYEV
jgi:hypothetical protein